MLSRGPAPSPPLSSSRASSPQSCSHSKQSYLHTPRTSTVSGVEPRASRFQEGQREDPPNPEQTGEASSQGVEPALGKGGGWEDQACEREHSLGSLDAQQAFLGPGRAVMSLGPAGVWGREDLCGGH